MNATNIDIYSTNLMLTEEQMIENKVPEQVIPRIVRLRDIYNYILRNPLKKDREYIDYIQARYKNDEGTALSRRTAYEDLEILHAIVGSLQQCSKEWHRWRFNNMIMEGYAIAVRKEDAAAIAKLAGQYGKYNKLDQEDAHDFNYGQLPKLQFTFDVSYLGFERIPGVRAVMDELIAHYTKSIYKHIKEDADIVEFTEAVEVTDPVTEKESEIAKKIEAHADATAIR